jgi:glycosyltransferase involved in cell wall biosynthesis
MLSLKPNMLGIGVPSRLYNYMAAGKPIIAVVDSHSEAALTIKEESLGWVVPPDHKGNLSQILLSSLNQKEELEKMGKKARNVSEKFYSKEQIVSSYVSVVAKVLT